MSPFLKRAALLAAVALALGACEFDLGIPEDTAFAPGASVPISNVDGDTCPVPDEPIKLAPTAVGDPDEDNGVAVAAWVVSDPDEFISEDPDPAAEVFTDADGFFKTTVPAPTRPGLHIVFAECNGDSQAPEVSPEAVNEDGGYFDLLRVAHAPLTIALSDDEVVPGTTVTATFPACQDDNDLGYSSPEDDVTDVAVHIAAEPTQDDVFTDYPDLQVFLDGNLVDTVEGTERYPTDDIQVPVTLTEAGAHEISGVCTFQTFDIDEALFEACFDESEECPLDGAGVESAADVDYGDEGFSPDDGLTTYDEDTSTAAAPITVTAPAVEPTQGAQPVQQQPTFTG